MGICRLSMCSRTLRAQRFRDLFLSVSAGLVPLRWIDSRSWDLFVISGEEDQTRAKRPLTHSGFTISVLNTHSIRSVRQSGSVVSGVSNSMRHPSPAGTHRPFLTAGYPTPHWCRKGPMNSSMKSGLQKSSYNERGRKVICTR